MHARKLISSYFALEGINSFGTTLYFYYLYFFTEKQFGFTKFQNLVLAAALGLTYAIASIIGGRFAQRRGYFNALKTGYAMMAVAIGVGAFLSSLAAHLGIMFVGMFGMALTWPALEALISECPSRHELQRNVGIYNLIWAGCGALAYFSGGALFKAAGFRAMFILPAAIHIVQLVATLFLERVARHHVALAAVSPQAMDKDEFVSGEDPIASAGSSKIFLRMAWLANPFAYLAINSVIAVMPAVANRLQLTVAQAGILCSVWLFVRTGSFLWLWLWPGWHYRFGWLVTAYAMMTLGFLTLLMAASLWLVILAQVVFGFALGLIYYSSLYYSMDAGDAKGEHGGFHEAMIGAGNCVGPAVGAAALHFFPNAPDSSTWTPTGLLVIGFGVLLWWRFRPFQRDPCQ